MKWMLSVSLLLSLLFSTSAAQYGGAYFILEIWGTSRPDSTPTPLADCHAEICPFDLWAHNSYEFVWVAVRLVKLAEGYTEVEFGLWNECSERDMGFLFFRTCPGLIQVPQQMSPPAACFALSLSGCKSWTDYVGYALYLADPGASCRFVVVPNADSEVVRVQNCRGTDYPWTFTQCCAQYSAVQTVSFCDDPGCPFECFGCNVTSVYSSSWGRIKALYR